MKSAWIAFAAGVPLAMLSGIESLGTVSHAQDRGIFQQGGRIVFDRGDETDLRDMKVLKSDDTECQGALLASGLEGAADIQSVRRGEERVFAVEKQNVPWACLSDKSARSGTMECPDGTSRVRITHEGDVAKFECYGRER